MERLTAQLHKAADNVPAEEIRSAQEAVERLGADFHQAIGHSGRDDAVGVLAQLRHASHDLTQAMSRAHQIVNALASFTNYLGLAPIRRSLPGSTRVAVPCSSTTRRPFPAGVTHRFYWPSCLVG